MSEGFVVEHLGGHVSCVDCDAFRAEAVTAGFVTKDSGERKNFAGGGHRDTESGKLDYTLAYDGPMFERYAALMTRGAQKYEARNWMKFQDQEALERAKRSLARHYHQYLRGDRDEDHAAAIIFNLNVIERLRGLGVKDA